MGQHTDHMPLPTLSQEAVTQHFSFILPTLPCALTLFILVSSFSFPYSKHLPCNATYCRPMPPAFPPIPIATVLPAPPLPLLPASTPPHMLQTAATFDTFLPYTSTPMHHIHSSFLFAFILPHLHVAALLAPPSIHLTAIASQCALKTPSPWKIVTD